MSDIFLSNFFLFAYIFVGSAIHLTKIIQNY